MEMRMKKWIVMIAAVAVAAGVLAGEEKQGATLEDYLANKRAHCARVGKTFSAGLYKKMFAKLDKDEDGILSVEEWPVGKNKKSK